MLIALRLQQFAVAIDAPVLELVLWNGYTGKKLRIGGVAPHRHGLAGRKSLRSPGTVHFGATDPDRDERRPILHDGDPVDSLCGWPDTDARRIDLGNRSAVTQNAVNQSPGAQLELKPMALQVRKSKVGIRPKPDAVGVIELDFRS
jgi:hypothetical protein